MISAITGHLQYTAAMQLSQLEKASFTLVMLDSALVIRLLFSNAACKLLARIPPTPPLTLLAIATSMEGILDQCSTARIRRFQYVGSPDRSPANPFTRNCFRLRCSGKLTVATKPSCPFNWFSSVRWKDCWRSDRAANKFVSHSCKHARAEGPRGRRGGFSCHSGNKKKNKEAQREEMVSHPGLNKNDNIGTKDSVSQRFSGNK